LFVVASQGLATVADGSGDQGKINVTISAFGPLLDKYGKPSINPDGTYYPNDKFTIGYTTHVAQNVIFGGVEAAYNKSALDILDNSNWGALNGNGNFEVASSAFSGKEHRREEMKTNSKVGNQISQSPLSPSFRLS
jgi:hypothetical protein